MMFNRNKVIREKKKSEDYLNYLVLDDAHSSTCCRLSPCCQEARDPRTWASGQCIDSRRPFSVQVFGETFFCTCPESLQSWPNKC